MQLLKLQPALLKTPHRIPRKSEVMIPWLTRILKAPSISQTASTTVAALRASLGPLPRTRPDPTSPSTLKAVLEEQREQPEGSEILADGAALAAQKPPWLTNPSAPDTMAKGMGGRPRTKILRKGHGLLRGGQLKLIQQIVRCRVHVAVLTKQSMATACKPTTCIMAGTS
jgi:hypothetical protein